MRCSVSVTFEFDVKPCLTAKIPLIEAGTPHTIASRALRQAKKELKPSRWRSLVVVLERIDEDKITINQGPQTESTDTTDADIAAEV